MVVWNNILGGGDGGLSGVKLGPGVVGNSTFAVIAAFVGIPATAWALSSHPDYALVAIAIEAFLLFSFLVGSWVYAHKHPDHALMGGAELLQLRKAQIAAPGIKVVENAPIVSDPENPVEDKPKIMPPEGGGNE